MVEEAMMNVALFLLLRAGSAAVVKINWQLPYPRAATHDFEVNSDDEIVFEGAGASHDVFLLKDEAAYASRRVPGGDPAKPSTDPCPSPRAGRVRLHRLDGAAGRVHGVDSRRSRHVLRRVLPGQGLQGRRALPLQPPGTGRAI